MDYDVSISIGTMANLGDLDKANKAVQDLGKQIDKLPPQLIPGGVGGTQAPAYNGGASSTANGMTWRLDGMTELTGAMSQTSEAVKQVDKTITITSQRLDKNSGWLSRSINTLASLPGKIQSWGSNTMQAWGQFNGPLQNVKNMISVGKQAWDLGWSLGESLNEAFGVKAKQIDAKVAGIIQAAQDKLARRQDNLNAARAQHREDAFLKQEAAGVKQVNDAYAARLRTIEAIDRKAMAGLDHQQKMLAIENEKNRSIIRQQQLQGTISEAQARDMLAAIDAKDANERMAIERKQAEQAAATSQAKAEAAQERYNKLLELSQSGMARQAVTDLKPVDILNKADSLKRAEEDLAKWVSIQKRQKDAQKEIQQAIKDQARAATMLPLVGAPIALARKQDEDQARQDYEAAIAAQHEFMRSKGMSFNETNKGNGDTLKMAVEQRRKALDSTLGRIDKTGLVGDLSGMDDDKRLSEYLRVLKLVKDVMANDAAQLEGIFLEAEEARQAAAEAKERVQRVTQEHQAQTAANDTVAQETAKANTKQDADRHADVMASALEKQLRKQIEAGQRKQETEKEKLDKIKESLSANMERVKDYTSIYQGSKTGDNLQKVLDLYAKLSSKPKWTKEESGEVKKLEKWVQEINKESNLAGKSKKYQGMAAALLRVLEAWKAARVKDAKIKKDDKAIRELERKAQDVSGLTGKIDHGKKEILTLDDWIARQRKNILGRTGEIAQQQPIGVLPEAAEVIQQALSEQGPGGIGISSGERKLLETLRDKLANDPRRLEAGNEFQEVINFISRLLDKYTADMTARSKITGDLAKLQARLDKIESQGKFGRRK
ncbi:MAG: hypothetical protein KHX31_13255 [Akkermansia sp.]|uniref:hypothetical protein n=1 Tax=Akkermansia sp. TaxID=1872421 RepID=UPI0025BF8730|nr:hypothetical protein [Akkermansia sp.]MBS5509589.1 hypothetical protein [Akkermansia sp.]